MLGALFEKVRQPFARRLQGAAEPGGAVQVSSPERAAFPLISMQQGEN
jgi:hypothetical protein